MSIFRSNSFFNSLGLVLGISLSSSAWAQTLTNPKTEAVPFSTQGSPTDSNIDKPSSGKLSPQEVKSLSPSSDLLLRPNKPSEVEIKVSKAITLKQAVKLGLQNNRDLQVTKLALERAQSQLKAAQAALLPTLNFNTQVSFGQQAQNDIQNQESY